MSTNCFWNVLLLIYIRLFYSFVYGYECLNDEDPLCDKYLTIHLKTLLPFPPNIFKDEFNIFATSWNYMWPNLCRYSDMPLPLFYYIRGESSSNTQIIYKNEEYDAYQFQFGINQHCNDSIPKHRECCNDLEEKYVGLDKFGILITAYVKHHYGDTIWANFSLQGNAIDYFFSYKLRNTSFPMPTVSPTLSPTQHIIDCQYTTNYLSIKCQLIPSYKINNDNNNQLLSIYQRSSYLCTKLLNINTLKLLGFECNNCMPATCQMIPSSYNSYEIVFIDIILTTDCSISINDPIQLCLTLNSDQCEHESIGYLKDNYSDSNINGVITDSSANLSNPFFISSQCMIYTVYNNIESDIGVKNIKSSLWNNQYCDGNIWCTYSTNSSHSNSSSYLITTSIVNEWENEWGSKHNISTKIMFQDNLPFIPLTFESTNFVAFKPLYINTDIYISCNNDTIDLNVDNWINKDIKQIFSSKWNVKSSETINENMFESLDRNLFINPLYFQQSLSDEAIYIDYKVGMNNLDILSSNVPNIPIISFPLKRKLGDINAIISNGVHQYFPYNSTNLISLIGNEYSFDQEINTDLSHWNYNWSCNLCPNQIFNQNTNKEAILTFNTNSMDKDTIYRFNLQIIDSMNDRMDETFMFITMIDSVLINNIASLNINWNKDLYYLPTHYTEIDIIAQISIIESMVESVDESMSESIDNDIIYNYQFCFEPKLENGIQCQVFESSDNSYNYHIDPFHTLPNHNYIITVNISSNVGDNAYCSTILEIAPLSHIIELNISSTYHELESYSSNLYKNLYKDSNTFIQFIDLNLLSMKANCLNPPCVYSYFYQINNPKYVDNTNIPFYFALGNSLSVSSFTQVIFPWNYNNFNILGCIQDIYGTTNCKLITYDNNNNNNINSNNNNMICDFITDLENHLILLKNVDDELSLAQFMTAVIFQSIDAENNQCIEIMTDLIMKYIDSYLINKEYFIYHPFYILQILYLIMENNVITPSSYSMYIEIYETISSSLDYTDFYLPYSDINYITWNVSFVMNTLSHSHSIMSILNDIDYNIDNNNMQCSSQIIDDISSSLNEILLNSNMNKMFEYWSQSLYLYGNSIEFIENKEYITLPLTEKYIDTDIINNTLQSISITNINFNQDDVMNLMLFTFNPMYITQECFTNIDESEYREIKMIEILMEPIQSIQESITFEFEWKLSNITLEKLNKSESFNIYCQELNIENNEWISETCESMTEIKDLQTKTTQSFECKCNGFGQNIYGLTIDTKSDSSLIIDDPNSQLLYLQTYQWWIFLILYGIIFIAYILPIIYFPKLSPKYYRWTEIESMICGLIIFSSITWQIIICVAALFVNNNGVKLWQFQVSFCLQCVCLGIYNLFLLIIVNDKKCEKFIICNCISASPKRIGLINAFLIMIILMATIIHSILITLSPDTYKSSIWSLWIVYISLFCLTILFISYLLYYWFKGKSFSGGKPFAYTEGNRETIAIIIIIMGILLYSFSILNSYILYYVFDYVLWFLSLHWLSFLFLAIIIYIVRRFESEEKKHHPSNTMGIPNTDDSENETSSDDAIIPPDGTLYNNNINNDNNIDQASRPSLPIKSSNQNTMALLASSSMDPNSINPKSALLLNDNGRAGNQFSSTSEDDFDHNQQQNIQATEEEEEEEEEQEEEEEEDHDGVDDEEEKQEDDEEEQIDEIGANDITLAMHGWPPGFNSRTMASGPSKTSRQITNDTTSQLDTDQLGTDHQGNTMSYDALYEPEMDDFLGIPNTHHTNHADEGLEIASDAQLYTDRKRINNNNDNKQKYSEENKFEYEPCSDNENGDSDPGYFDNNHHDHITQIGADEYAQVVPPGHIVGVTMSVSQQNIDINDDEHQHEQHQNDIEATAASTSSMGIFDWNTPPPINSIIKEKNIDLSGWINSNTNSNNKQGLKLRGPTSISRRHTVNSSSWRRKRVKQKQYTSYEKEGGIQYTKYGTGAGASVVLEDDNNDNDDDDENSEEKRYYPMKNKISIHSRQTTATSFTGTFTQPEYPNIITATNEIEHQQILKTKNLVHVPYNKTINHLDSQQKEIVDIFEQNDSE